MAIHRIDFSLALQPLVLRCTEHRGLAIPSHFEPCGCTASACFIYSTSLSLRTSITIFSVSRRRRLRRNRALARALWFRFSKQQIRLTRQQLRWIQGTLAAHHSRDVHHLQAISRAMSQFRLEESYPWRCQCSRLNKKSHDHCPQCKRHWTTGRRHETQPAAYPWHTEEERQWKEWESPRQGRQKQKPSRSKSLRAKKGKGKGSFGGNEPPQPSPFANPAMIPPWPLQDLALLSGIEKFFFGIVSLSFLLCFVSSRLLLLNLFSFLVCSRNSTSYLYVTFNILS